MAGRAGAADGGAIDPPLASTAAIVATALVGTRDRWWIIASAAVALHGADPGTVGDVDVLMSTADAYRFCTAQRIACGPGQPDGRFRSAVFARWPAPPLPVEIMAGFDVATRHGWTPIWPATRRAIVTPGGPVYVPERAELAAMLRAFGRPKDIARAATLAG